MTSSLVDIIVLCVGFGGALTLTLVEGRRQETLVRYKNTAYLMCQDEKVETQQPQSVLTYQWVLPSGEIATVENINTNPSKHTFLQDGFTLQIQDVDETDYGVYVCLVFSNQTHQEILHTVQHGLNTQIWSRQDADYSLKFQYGFVAGFVIFVIMGLTCYNYNQHQERCDIIDKHVEIPMEMKVEHHSSNGHELPQLVVSSADVCHDNTGFQNDKMDDVNLEEDVRL